MGCLSFFGIKDSKISVDVALAQLREVESEMIKRQGVLERKIKVQTNIATQNAVVNMRLALRALRTKNAHLKEIKRIDGTLNTIQVQMNNLENAITNAKVLKAMNMGSKALKAVQVDINKVREVMKIINEQNELADEIADAISNPNAVDDSELLAELEQLQQADSKSRTAHSKPVETTYIVTQHVQKNYTAPLPAKNAYVVPNGVTMPDLSTAPIVKHKLGPLPKKKYSN